MGAGRLHQICIGGHQTGDFEVAGRVSLRAADGFAFELGIVEHRLKPAAFAREIALDDLVERIGIEVVLASIELDRREFALGFTAGARPGKAGVECLPGKKLFQMR